MAAAAAATTATVPLILAPTTPLHAGRPDLPARYTSPTHLNLESRFCARSLARSPVRRRRFEAGRPARTGGLAWLPAFILVLSSSLLQPLASIYDNRLNGARARARAKSGERERESSRSKAAFALSPALSLPSELMRLLLAVNTTSLICI